MNRLLLVVLALCLPAAALRAPAAGPSLVPDTPSTAPDYFCTWNAQGFVSSYSGPSPQADAMTEANLFGKGHNQNWVEFFPEARADMIFLLDDAYDFPLGGGHNHPLRGNLKLHPERFPSYQGGTPAEGLAKLNRDVRAHGWRGLGLWICNSRPNLNSEPINSQTYWTERLRWCQQAGLLYWKVDWGIGVKGKPLWKFEVTPEGRQAAPDLWLEAGTGDVYRTYDVQVPISIPETIRRIAAFLQKPTPVNGSRRLINCEDEVIIGAAMGCVYGVMRHPLDGNMPNGRPDRWFTPTFRNLRHRMDEVTRAVHWHRLALPFVATTRDAIDTTLIKDGRHPGAPARIARGGLALPKVSVPDGGEPPFVLCSRHPDGEISVAAIGRTLGQDVTIPRADVTLEAGELNRPVGIFGEFNSLTLVTTSDLKGKRILAQDLAGKTPVDITGEVKFSEGRLRIPGAVIHRVGLMAATPGDVSDPGLVLAVEGLTKFIPKTPMKPGKFAPGDGTTNARETTRIKAKVNRE